MTVLVGDCVEVMAGMDAASVDAIATDPPYGLEFMGKDWDRLSGQPGYVERGRITDRPDAQVPYGRGGGVNSYQAGQPMQAWHEAWAREALRVLKPGGHLLAFGGTRTYHRLMVGLEDAGFEIRDCLMYLYGSGFPKSLDVSKAIDKAAGAEREVVGRNANHRDPVANAEHHERWNGAVLSPDVTAPATPAAAQWQGWGTALKPAWEPVVVARKPLVGTVAGNVLAYGTGALNIDACRIGFASSTDEAESKQKNRHADFGSGPRENAVYGEDLRDRGAGGNDASGRWPANVVLSHDEDCVLVGESSVRANGHHPAARGASGYGSAVEDSNGGGLKGQDGLEERRADGEVVQRWACVPGCPVRVLDDQVGELRTGRLTAENQARGGFAGTVNAYGTAARGGTNEYEASSGGPSRFFYCAKAGRAERNAGLPDSRNVHPTVKPIDLMRWLVRLVTPAGGRVLDPFAGSGTTGCAAALEGVEFVGIERDAEYAAIAEARIGFWREHPTGLPVEQALVAEGERRRVRESGQLGLGI